jgi:hypothetical protein
MSVKVSAKRVNVRFVKIWFLVLMMGLLLVPSFGLVQGGTPELSIPDVSPRMVLIGDPITVSIYSNLTY